MKILTTVLSLLLSSSFAFGVMLPEPKENNTPYAQNNVLRSVIGSNDCLECRKNFKTGANKDDDQLIRYHKNQIFGGNSDKSDSGAVDGN